jgi:cell division septal protein FtsQ
MPRWKRWFFAFSAVALPIGGGTLGVRALSQPQFNISTIDITGTACLDQNIVKKEIEGELSEHAGLFFTRANKLLFSSNKLATRLTHNLPINHAEITVEGSVLHVTIQEDVVMVLVNSNDSWLLSDLEGHVLRALSTDEIPLLDSPTIPPALPFEKIPKILLREGVPADLKELMYPSTMLIALAELDKGLRAVGLTPHRYKLEKRKDTWLSVETKEKDYAVFIDLEHPVDAQLRTLSAILSQRQELANMSYLDLRFGNRVYMK